MSTLSVKLAKEFFLDDLTAKCTVKGTREYGPLLEADLMKLKCQLFPNMILRRHGMFVKAPLVSPTKTFKVNFDNFLN